MDEPGKYEKGYKAGPVSPLLICSNSNLSAQLCSQEGL